MRSANLIITGAIATFATALAIYTAPVGTRELHYWAMNLGLTSSAAVISWLFFVTLLAFKSNKLKSQLLILLGYAGSLVCSTTSGASFGAVYFIMQAEKINFQAAFQSAAVVILGGYLISLAAWMATSLFLLKQQNTVKSA